MRMNCITKAKYLGKHMAYKFWALLFLTCACHHKPDHSDLAFAAMKSYVKQIQKSSDLKLTGMGGSMNDIERFEIWLERNDKVSLADARKLIIKLTEGLIDKINADEKIRPFLHSYPIANQNVNIHIIFKAAETPSTHDFPYFVSLHSGKLWYRARGMSEYNDELILNESYAEAMKISR